MCGESSLVFKNTSVICTTCSNKQVSWLMSKDWPTSSYHFGQKDSNSHLLCGFGSTSDDHKHHCKTNYVDLSALKCHTTNATQRIIKDRERASTVSSTTSLQYLVLMNRNVFVKQMTIWSIQKEPGFLLLLEIPHRTGQSTASQLVNWLREQSADEPISLC
jgi:hypothetical protein